MSIDDFKKKTCLDNEIWTNEDFKEFLDQSKEILSQYIFEKKIYQANQSKSTHNLPLDIYHISDYLTYDDEINASGSYEVYAYEQDPSTKLTTDITSHVNGATQVPVNEVQNQLIVTFDDDYPTQGKYLYVEYYIAALPWQRMRHQVKQLQMLVALRELMYAKPMAAVGVMADNWSINGVSINAGSDTLNVKYDNINMPINRLIDELMIVSTKPKDLNIFDNPYTYYKY